MAASGIGSKAGLGWLVLVGVLAVPGFLFYNWWSHMKADRDRSVATKARGRLPDGAVFQTLPAATTLAAARVASSATVAAVPVPRTPVPAQKPMLAPPDAPAAPLPAAAPSSATIAGFVLSRDPMLSPTDIVRIREAELERARIELEEANRRRQGSRRPGKRVETPIENHIELQGVVDTPDGASLAIVNNATMSRGQSFPVRGYPAKVRVVKISSLGVTFEYQKRRFTKSLNP